MESLICEAHALSRTAAWPPAQRVEDPLQPRQFGTLATIGSTARWDPAMTTAEEVEFISSLVSNRRAGPRPDHRHHLLGHQPHRAVDVVGRHGAEVYQQLDVAHALRVELYQHVGHPLDRAE